MSCLGAGSPKITVSLSFIESFTKEGYLTSNPYRSLRYVFHSFVEIGYLNSNPYFSLRYVFQPKISMVELGAVNCTVDVGAVAKEFICLFSIFARYHTPTP